MSSSKQVTKAKTKQRVPAMVLGLLLVVGAGVGVALWSSAQSERAPVLIAANALDAGDVVAAADLRVAWVAVDDAVLTMPDTAQAGVVGSTVLTAIPAGSLVGPAMFGTEASLVPDGMALVGATLDTGRYPSSGVRVGDRVVLVHTTSDGPVRLGEADVFAVTSMVDSLSGDLFVSLLVPEGQLVDELAGAAAGEDLTLVSVAIQADS